MSQDFKDYYSILDISFQATEAEIKAAYRKMAREIHPDMHPDEAEHYTEQFQQVSEAYEILSDPFKKGTYDFRYRQFVLHEGPQYVEEVDETPPDTKQYKHKYTSRNRRSFSYASIGALILLFFQVLRMVVDAAPIEDRSHYSRGFHPLPSTPVQARTVNQNVPAGLEDSMNFSNSAAPFMDKARK